MSTVILMLITLIAYFIKGLSGFGPALVIVPAFTLASDVAFALTASAFFDAIAGFLLIIIVWQKIDWRFILPVLLGISLGSLAGAEMVFIIPAYILRKIIGIFLITFVIYLLLNKDTSMSAKPRSSNIIRGLAGLLSGICGGLVGMSGPPLIAYMKYYYEKDFFRTQLIAVFLVEKLVRLLVYGQKELLPLSEWGFLVIYLPFLFAGLWLGNFFHSRVTENLFNKVVAAILVFPAFKLILL